MYIQILLIFYIDRYILPSFYQDPYLEFFWLLHKEK